MIRPIFFLHTGTLTHIVLIFLHAVLFIYLFPNSCNKIVYYNNHDSQLTVALLARDTLIV